MVECVTPEPVRAVLAGEPSLFLSPHLDDVVLSCGLLLARAASAGPSTVATVFSAAAPGPHTRAARSFIRNWAPADGEDPFARRRSEDTEVISAVGAHPVHLGRCDALFRTSQARARALRWAGVAAPELVHRYPTYWLDIARGRVAKAERHLAEELAEEIGELRTRLGAEIVFCPLGVGRHVDHLLVRAVGALLDCRVIYYSDFPYSVKTAPESSFLASHGLRKWTLPDDPAVKAPLIRGYQTQFDALFPGGSIPPRVEEYYAVW